MTVELVDRWPRELQSAVAKVVQAIDSFDELELPDGAVNIKLVDDAEIAGLNETYSGEASPTDVLTFAYDEDEIEDGELADIVISTETAERQAKAAGVGLEDEVALLALHGILHAIGIDHQDDQSQDAMDGLQAELMAAAGLAYHKAQWKH